MKKRSIEILIFGWAEVVVGAGLLIVAARCLPMFSKLAEADAMLGYGVNMIIFTFSRLYGVYIFVSGLLILNLKQFGRWMNIFGACYIILRGLFWLSRGMFLCIKEFSSPWFSITTILIPLLGLLPVVIGISIIFFFTRIKVKEQFIRK